MSFQGPIIFVDESGDPGLNLQRSRCRYFTIGFVYTPSPGILRKKLRRILKRAHLRGRYPPQTGELKFYLPETDLIQKGLSKKDIARFRAQMPDLRKKSIDAITSSQAQTFVAVVDKSKAQGWKSQEELYNFTFAQTLLVNVMNVISPPVIPLIVYDKGRLSQFGTHKFAQYLVNKDSYFEQQGLKQYRGSLGIPNHVPSYSEAGIWAADILAGAFYHEYENKDPTYSRLFSSTKVGGGLRLYW